MAIKMSSMATYQMPPFCLHYLGSTNTTFTVVELTDQGSNRRSTTLEANTLIITPTIWLKQYFSYIYYEYKYNYNK
jgi:hypothetical protein